MESPNQSLAEPEWVSAVLDPIDRVNLPEIHQTGPTVRAEYVRRVLRSDLGADQEAVLRAGVAALDGRLGSR
jgi:hypothetical protein